MWSNNPTQHSGTFITAICCIKSLNTEDSSETTQYARCNLNLSSGILEAFPKLFLAIYLFLFLGGDMTVIVALCSYIRKMTGK